MKIHLLSGFLGSGKTTAIRTAAAILKNSGVMSGVITNDQGIRLVDGGFLAAAGIPGRQVMNGCFCCNYSDLDRQIGSLSRSHQPEVVFAESVGSCTDIVATVVKPLQSFHPESTITLSVVCDSLLLKMLLLEEKPLFEPEVAYIFWKQIEEASLILLNKSDLVTEAVMQDLVAGLQKSFGVRATLPLLANDPDSVAQWLAVLDAHQASPELSPELDYDIYAAGEAMMGWLDTDILIQTPVPGSAAVAKKLVEKLSTALRFAGYPVGHVKWLIDDKQKLSLTTVSEPQPFPPVPEALITRLLLNARVQVHPEKLAGMVADCIAATATETGASISTHNHSAFQPGYPQPEHRIS